MKWLDHIHVAILVGLAVIMAVMPPGEPHLWQKLNMLFAGALRKPLDVFDLFWHGAPTIVLLLKLGRMAWLRHSVRAGDTSE